jgi:hypothetical protein
MPGPNNVHLLFSWHTTLQTTCRVVRFHLFYTIVVLIGTILTALPWSSMGGTDLKCNSIMAIFLYFQSSYLFIVLILYHCYKSQHAHLKLAGHISAYSEFQEHIKRIMYVPCVCAAVSLALLGIYSNFYPSMMLECSFTSFKSPIPSIGLVILLQSLFMTYLIIIYFRDIHKFRRNPPLPDVERSDLWPAGVAPNVVDIGYWDNADSTLNLLERH